MEQNQTFLNRSWTWLLALCALPVLVSPILQYLTLSPVGSQAFLWVEMLLMLPLVVAFLTLPITALLLLVERWRPWVVRILAGTAMFILATLVGIKLGVLVRRSAFHDLATRSQPLVKAIRAYETQHGQPPPDLKALVPAFLPAVPTTGMAAYPKYDYITGTNAVHFHGNAWVLSVFTPSGGINFDQFLYFPNQNYPKTGHGGWLEPMADWAYVHE